MSRGKPEIFSPETPHFFKIVLEETLSEEKLRIPYTFWSLYGGTLEDTVLLKLPCGSEWEMQLSKHNGKFWLKAGWSEFANHYALERGDLLVFRYEGKSKFHVVIFDTTTVEIDYPFVDPSNEEIREDEISPLPKKTGEKPPLQSPRPLKRAKATKGDLDASKGDGVKSTTERKTKALTGHDKLAALEKACSFKSKRPCVKILIQPSYARQNGVIVPFKFANKYLANKSDSMILKVSGMRTWIVKYHRFKSSCRRRSITRIWGGWYEFAKDNHLKVGDVCVFILLKGKERSFEVVIFRASGCSKVPISSDLESGSVKEEGNSPASPAEKMNEGTLTPKKTSMKPNRKDVKKQRLFSKAEKDRILERARYNSGRPFFKAVIQPSYAVGAYLAVPSEFAKRYVKKKGNVALLDNNGRSWSTHLDIVRLNNGYSMTLLRDGWRVFANENNLEAGDVCIFELVKKSRAKMTFKVSIVRVSDHDN